MKRMIIWLVIAAILFVLWLALAAPPMPAFLR